MAEFNILDHLEKLTPDGGSAPRGEQSFHCPACESKNFKVHLTNGKWSTFSCDCADTESGKRKIRNALSPAINPNAKDIRPKRERCWTYTDANGTPILEVHRTDDGTGNKKIWQKSLVAGKRPAEVAGTVTPYGLQDALQALADGAPFVFMPEGEPCVDVLRAAGFPAITSLGGAGKFDPKRDGGLIPPDRLVVVPDRDQPGLKHAQQIADAHPGCQWLYPFPNTPQWNGSCPASGGLDIADWIAQGATVDQILAGIGEQLTNAPQQPQQQPQGFQSKPSPPKKKERKPRPLSHARRMECFNRCVEVQAKRQRNSLRRRARLLKAAKDLEINSFVNRQEIAQLVLEAKDRQQGHCFAVLTAQDRAVMAQPVIRWAIPSLVPEGDLTIIGGRPKVGKTRLAVAMAAAALNGTDCIGFGEPDPRTVLLVTDDQADGDTCAMLQALKVWDHPNLLWSRHFRFQENDLDALLEALKLNPGALVIIDSLRSISRSLQYGENDPEIGAALYDLKQAVIDSGSTLVLIHHCNKSADLVGTEALSGHNAIAGAANTVITLHYCPDANGKPDKSNPQRRMVREARTGDGCDIVIDRGAVAGSFRQVADFSHWQQQLEQAKKNQKEVDQLEGLTKDQREVLDVVTDNDGLTVRQVAFNWKDREPTKREVEACRKVLTSLKRKALVSERPAKNGATFHEKTTPPTLSPEKLGDLGGTQSGTDFSWGASMGGGGRFGRRSSTEVDLTEPEEADRPPSDPLPPLDSSQTSFCPPPTKPVGMTGFLPNLPSSGGTCARENTTDPPSPAPLWDPIDLDDLPF